MKRNILASFVVLLTGILIFGSCNKIDTTDLGNELIPGSDNVETFDTTLDVITDNLLTPATDTIKMLYTELHTAGVIDNDLEFGKTETHFYTSFVQSQSHTYPFVKKDTVRIDSVVLSLGFSQLYGDSNSVENFEVREIFTGFKFKDTGYQIDNPDLPVRPEVIGNKTAFFYTLNNAQSYKNGKDTVNTTGGELRIKLDTAWARRFVSYDTTASSAYNTDSTFMEAFRGFEVRINEGASPVKRALAYFDLTDNTRTRITFYCRIQNNGRTDTIAPYFMYKSGDPQANIVRRTPANAYLTNVNNGLPDDQMLYLQTTPGSYAKVEIPGLSNLDNRVIHRAELICERVPSQDDKYYLPPPYMFIDAFSQTGDSIFTIRNDFIRANTDRGYDVNTLGGLFKNNQYVFSLTRYVQSIVTKKQKNYTLRISSPFTAILYYLPPDDTPSSSRVPLILNPTLAGGRVVLYGGSHPDSTKRMRLRIIYSKI